MILLTGTSGFIGSRLLSFIKETGDREVIALTSKPIDGIKCILHHNYSFDQNLMVDAGYADAIDTIIHAGAFTPRNINEANWVQECNQNIFSLEKLLKLELPNLKKIVFLSTLDVYGSADIFDENSIVNPSTLYGYSKLYGEKMVSVFAQQRGIDYQILRVGHVYGPGEERYEKIIPVTLRKLIDNDEIEIWGTGNELRAFIYIDDVVKAITNSLKITEEIGPINLVSDQSISIKDLVQELINISGKESLIKYVPVNTEGKSFQFDNSKLKKYLLQEYTHLKEGLTMEWNYMNSL